MKSGKYYVTITGFNVDDKNNIYRSKDFTDKEKAIMEFVVRQVKGITLEYPYSSYDEVWIYLRHSSGTESYILCSTRLGINVLKADYK